MNEKMMVSDEDFSSILTFKNGSISIDYASMILLYGYFSGRNDWYYAVKEKEIKEFEYRSYVEFSRSLLNQLLGMIKEYTLVSGKKERISIVNNMRVLCGQINSFCRSNENGVNIGANLNLVTDAHLSDDVYWDVWNKVIHPLQDEVIALKHDEDEYYKSYKQDVERNGAFFVRNLPNPVKGAKSLIVDMIQEKEDNVRNFYDRLNIYYAYLNLKTAIDNGNYREIADAHKKILDQCRIANECEASPFRGDLRPMFTFSKQADLIEHIKYGDAEIQTELVNIDMFARGNKTAKLSEIKDKSIEYISSTIETAKRMGLLSDEFDIDKAVQYSEEELRRKEAFEEQEMRENPFVPSM